MAYAEAADIERLMAQFPTDANSKPNITEVDSIIADTEQEVNVALSSARITVPVTTPAHFLGWLKLVVGYGATAAILKSKFPDATGPAETPAYAFWEARYKAALKGIIDGTLVPNDVSRSVDKVKPNNYFTQFPGGVDMGDNEPWFRRNRSF